MQIQLWEVAQPYVLKQAVAGDTFTAVSMAQDLGITTSRASHLIQAYLRAQRNKNSRTSFVLSRSGRTRGAIWHVGARTEDARALARQEANDMVVRVMRAIAPDLKRMGTSNPRVNALAQAMTTAFVANLNALVAALP